MGTETTSRTEEIQDLISEIIEDSGVGETFESVSAKLAEMRRHGLTRPQFNLESPYSQPVHWCETESGLNQ